MPDFNVLRIRDIQFLVYLPIYLTVYLLIYYICINFVLIPVDLLSIIEYEKDKFYFKKQNIVPARVFFHPWRPLEKSEWSIFLTIKTIEEFEGPLCWTEFEFDVLWELFLTFACLILFLHLYPSSLPYRTCSVPCHFYSLPIIVTLTRKTFSLYSSLSKHLLSLKGYGGRASWLLHLIHFIIRFADLNV